MDNRTIREEIARTVAKSFYGTAWSGLTAMAKGECLRTADALLPLITTAREEGATELYEYRGFVIMNHLGQVWGPRVFDSIDAAYAYIASWQAHTPEMDLSKHRVVPGYSLTFALPPSQ